MGATLRKLVTSRLSCGLMLTDLLGFIIACVVCYGIFLYVFSGPRKKFLVLSGRCQIPDIDPWDPSILEFVTRKEKPIVCTSRPPLTYTAPHSSRQRLHIAADAVHHYASSLRDISCCFAIIARNTDSENAQNACISFEGYTTLPRNVQHVFVECVSRANRMRVYANVHAVVQVSRNMLYAGRRLSVVVLGIDTMSRLNFERTMPKTAGFLKSSGWLEMRGYNKMADNTLPNLMAVMTGLSEEQSRDIDCLLPNAMENGYGHCPFLWREFKRKGYVTAYNEDETNLSTFNYMSVGYKQKPTDYYMHPLMVEARNKLTAVKSGGFSVCVGETRVADLLLKNTLDLMTTFKGNLFALTWLNNFSHDNHQLPATMDDTMLQFFHALQETEGFQNTIFVFLSDHGFRYGPIRQTHVGWLEECLPFLYFHLPPRFLAAYPAAAADLAGNGDRLTSPYDLHLTLRDILEDNISGPGTGTEGCSTCQTMFRPVNVERSCREAGIPEHWCTCLDRTPIDKSGDVVRLAAATAINHVNSVVLSGKTDYADGEECALLSVSEIISARVVVDEAADGYEDYGVVFSAEPGAVVMHATVRHRPDSAKPQFQVLGMVSRVSVMHGESCPSVTDKSVEYYCQCIFS